MIDCERVPCPRCGSANSRAIVKGRDYLHRVPGEFFVSECEQCGLWFQNPRPVVEQLTTLYPSDYVPHESARPAAGPAVSASRATYLRTTLGYEGLSIAPGGAGWRGARVFDVVRRWSLGVELIPRFVRDGTLLEIGCGSGARLIALRGLGWRALHGIELVPAAAARARAHGFAVECGQVEDVLDSYPDHTCDAVVSSMVLEHLRDPFRVVRQIAAKLKPGGQFLFSTISRDSLDAWMYGPHWSGFDFPRHLVHFRRGDIDRMLADEFEEVEYFHQGAPIDFVRSSTWRRLDGQNRLIDALIVRFGRSKAAELVCMGLAWLGLTCRVSCRCRRSIGVAMRDAA